MAEEDRSKEEGEPEAMHIFKILAWFFLPRLVSEVLLNHVFYPLLYRKTLAFTQIHDPFEPHDGGGYLALSVV